MLFPLHKFSTVKLTGCRNDDESSVSFGQIHIMNGDGTPKCTESGFQNSSCGTSFLLI